MQQPESPYEVFHGHGIQFSYPDDWEIEINENDEGVIINLDSPLTVSMMMSLLESRPEASDLISQVIDVFKEEYEEVDIYEAQEQRIGHYSVMTQELEFVCHELINTVKCTALRTGSFTMLVMSQGHDRDMEEFSGILDKIFQSLEIDQDDDKLIC